MLNREAEYKKLQEEYKNMQTECISDMLIVIFDKKNIIKSTYASRVYICHENVNKRASSGSGILSSFSYIKNWSLNFQCVN